MKWGLFHLIKEANGVGVPSKSVREIAEIGSLAYAARV
jgi:hypothetical protein